MIAVICRIILVAIISSFLGISMKIADLLDEHGYKWFRHSDIIMGVIWGLLGAALIFYDNMLAILWISVALGFLIRCRIDYPNHGVAVVIWFLAAFFKKIDIFANWQAFVYLFLGLTITGMIHDEIQYKNKKVNKKLRMFFYDYHLHWYIIIVLYLIFTRDFITFFSLISFSYSYGLVASGRLNAIMGKVGIRKK